MLVVDFGSNETGSIKGRNRRDAVVPQRAAENTIVIMAMIEEYQDYC